MPATSFVTTVPRPRERAQAHLTDDAVVDGMANDERTRVEDAPRSATGREWEVFVREVDGGPLKHTGSVTAASGDEAQEHASQLFQWVAEDIWLCPADETRRFTTHSLDHDRGAGQAESLTDESSDDQAELSTGDSGGESA